MTSATALSLPDAVEYPCSDGTPMAETDTHRDDMTYLVEALADHFRERSDVYVSANLFFYYERGNPRACVAPDLFVVEGVGAGQRKCYFLWKEGRVPSLVMEVTSASTRRQDQVEKKALYARLGVPEYFLFDPLGEYLRPRLQGYRLWGQTYRRLRETADGTLRSRTLGLGLTVVDGRLRLRDVRTGEWLLRSAEVRSQCRMEAAGRREAEVIAITQGTRLVQHATNVVKEAVRANDAEAKAVAATLRADREAARADEEAARADREAAARQALAEELARLRAAAG